MKEYGAEPVSCWELLTLLFVGGFLGFLVGLTAAQSWERDAAIRKGAAYYEVDSLTGAKQFRYREFP